MVDAAGTLVFANARWSSWTGFPAEEFVGRPAPFPFWVSHRELATLANRSPGPAHPAGVFPFRHRSDSVFWCQLETAVEELGGRLLTFAFLRRMPPTSPASASQRLLFYHSFLDVAEDLPFALVLTNREGVVRWANGIFLDTVARTAEIQELPLRTWFTRASAAALEHLFHTPAAQLGHMGRLALERPDETGAGGLTAYWLPASLPDGAGFLFAFSDDWEALCPPDDVTAAWQRSRPGLARLALLLQPGNAWPTCST